MTRTTRGPGRPRQPIQREELLGVARAAFAAHGYAGASMNDIAEQAGLRKSSLFHHFATKEALYEAVFESILADLARLLPAPSPDAPYLEQLDALGRAVVRYLGSTPDASRLLILEIVGGGPVVQSEVWQAVVRLELAIAGFLEVGMARGALPPQDPRQLAMSIMGLHLTWFAARGATRELLGADPFAPEQVEARAEAAVAHVRALCGVGD